MTRATRRGNKKTSLPTATPWKALNREGYTKIEDEENVSSNTATSSSGNKTHDDVPLKITKKPKLVDKTKQLDKLLAGKKIKSAFGDSETVALLPLSSTAEEKTAEKTAEKASKRSSKNKVGFPGESHQNGQHGGKNTSGRKIVNYSSRSATTHSSYMDEKRKKQIEARRLRRQKRKVCFNCRNYGHMVHNCPQPQANESSTSGICFKCGSADHTSKVCRVKVADGEFPYAKCFICGEIGHLSRSCPDNPKGLYPHGGCCRICGSVEHLKSNCPEKANKSFQSSGFSTKDLVITNPTASIDAEETMASNPTIITSERKRTTSRRNPSKQKIVKF